MSCPRPVLARRWPSRRSALGPVFILALAALLVVPPACTTVAPSPARAVVVPRESDRILTLTGINWNELLDVVEFCSRYPATDPKQIGILIMALEVSGVREFLLRERAARALALAGDIGAVPALVRRLEEDPDADVRKAAAHALGALRAREAVPTLFARVLDTTEAMV